MRCEPRATYGDEALGLNLTVCQGRTVSVGLLPYAEYPRGPVPPSNCGPFFAQGCPFSSDSRARPRSWEELRNGGARVWHLIADKTGAHKEAAMRKAGVWAVRDGWEPASTWGQVEPLLQAQQAAKRGEPRESDRLGLFRSSAHAQLPATVLHRALDGLRLRAVGSKLAGEAVRQRGG
eukprot:2659759-Prymnesium_polylepis.3